MQPPPRKGKLSQVVKLHFAEQLCGLQSKQQRDAELLEDIRSYSKQRAAIEREYGQALQRLASQFVKRDWQRGRSDAGDSRSVFAVWKGIIEGTAYTGQARVTASESYRSLAAEATKSSRMSKERMLKKSMEQLQKAQAELLETVKELDKAKKQFSHLQRSSEVAKDKAADVEARLRKSDRRIFHTKASLQKLSAKFSMQMAEYSKQRAGVQNEYVLTLVSANAHLEHYYHVELPAIMQALDGDLYERLRDHLSTAGRAEVESCEITQDWFQRISEAAARVCREQDLLLFLQDHTAFMLVPEQRFQLDGIQEMSLLQPEDGGASLEKEARRWAMRATRDSKNKAHGEEVLQRLEARRHQVPEAEVAAVERQMEEVRENIWKAEVGRAKAEARLALLRTAGLDVDSWLAGAVRAGVELPRTPSTEAPTGLDPTEFDDYDSDETFEEAEPGHAARTYPYTCRVIFGYQGCHADELSIAQGEELEVIEDGDMEEWVKARNKAGQVGYVPEKYLLCLSCVGSESGSAASTGTTGPSGAALQRQLSSIMAAELVLEPGAWLVRALYDYEGQSPEELSFPEGAIIRVLPRAEDEVDDGFWTGDFDGRVGVFPSLVVEELTGARGTAGQELPSPSPPPFSPPGLALSASLGSGPELLLEGECQGGGLGGTQSLSEPSVDLVCRHEGTSSGQSSPDLAANRIRPLRAPPPPPGRAPDLEQDLS
ncbi:F-BAR and double SH3 domains protein 1 isoform X1 [Meleagris gallopavo]|uniref:F-BAR and double SH3 domains protein 1 isoform X1 n=1 Tax=Meleagris gallopavo TaxID=9103 RepID=UPI000549AD77|nr:F-BAR and double SH3 domains protein 1 isoform X1 [Meleagris gallopavo]